MEEGKETKGKLVKTKRQRISRREREEERDRLSELPDCVLLHIMKFMNTKCAVQTCILSKRWKDLWKCLTVLSFYPWEFRRVVNLNKFVSKVLSSRDGSISLLNLCIWAHSRTTSKLLNRVMKYAALHDVQTIEIYFSFRKIPNFFNPLIFSCQSLTSLRLYNSGSLLELPKSLQLPALKNLFLEKVTFYTRENGCAEPFSTCNLLNTLGLSECSLHNDANALFISNSNLSSLKLRDTFQNQIVLSTPNLSALTIIQYLGFSCQPISSTCNLSCLEEGTIETTTNISYSVVIGWLQVLTNLKILTLSYDTLMIILRDLSNLSTMRTQPPCFVRLESLKVKMDSCLTISDEQVNRVMEYLLQNSPMTRVSVINC